MSSLKLLFQRKTNKSGGFWAVFLVMMLQACTSSDNSSAVVGDNKAVSALPIAGDSSDGVTVVNSLPVLANTSTNSQPIAENDLLEIDVFQVDTLDKTVRVDSQGVISLPLIGQVKVAGKSASEVENDLERRYGQNYLQSPDITVFVKESAGQQLTMDGEFRRPGIYPTTTQTTLLRAVAQAGGLSELADEKKVFVFRTHNNQKLVANYDIKEIREGNKSDPKLFGGDTIIAFTSKSKVAAENLRQALGIASNAARVATPF